MSRFCAPTVTALVMTVCCHQVTFAQTNTPSPADLKKRYAERTALLHEAAEKGQVSLLLEVLKSGADVNDKDEQGRTPLHKAADKGNRSAAIALLMFGADVGEKDAKGQNPIHLAAAGGHTELLTLFFNPHTLSQIAGDVIKGGAAEALKGAGFSLKGATDKFTTLVGSSNSAVDVLGQTPIMKAAANGHSECVRAIGVYYDRPIKDKAGRTTLMLAAEGGYTELIRTIFTGAQPRLDYLQMTNDAGKTATQIAEAANHPATAKLLKELEQKAQAEELKQVLLKLARENDVAGLKAALAKSDGHAVPPGELMVAATTFGNTQVVQYLMETHKEKPIEDKVRLVGYPLNYTRPQSAFHVASSNAHLETLKALTDLKWWNDNATLADILRRKDQGASTYRSPLELANNNTIAEFLNKKFKELEGKK